MNSDGVDLKKRRFLTTTTAVVGGVGGVFAVVPFIKNWNPSQRARAAGAPEEADISGLAEGALMRVKWRGKVCWIVHRSKQQLADLVATEGRLADANSAASRQPSYCVNKHRSIKPEYLVAVGICTHLGCSPTYRPEVAPADMGPDWKGGFYCPCHGSKFDMAGRVFAGAPAPTNLEIPRHQYIADDVILIGVDGGDA